jgi:hypothetical protein
MSRYERRPSRVASSPSGRSTQGRYTGREDCKNWVGRKNDPGDFGAASAFILEERTRKSQTKTARAGRPGLRANNRTRHASPYALVTMKLMTMKL